MSTLSQVVAPLFFLAAAMLIVTGAIKLRNPSPTAIVLDRAGIHGSRGVVRMLGFTEVTVGLACLAFPTLVSGGALAALYVGFAAFLLYLIVAKPGSSSCGCFGVREVPPSLFHVTLNLVAATAGGTVPFARLSGFPVFLWHLGSRSVPFVIGLWTVGYLGYAGAAFLPETMFSFQKAAKPKRERSPSERYVQEDAMLTSAGVAPGHPSLLGLIEGGR